jgi:hypothetical protein
MKACYRLLFLFALIAVGSVFSPCASLADDDPAAQPTWGPLSQADIFQNNHWADLLSWDKNGPYPDAVNAGGPTTNVVADPIGTGGSTSSAVGGYCEGIMEYRTDQFVRGLPDDSIPIDPIHNVYQASSVVYHCLTTEVIGDYNEGGYVCSGYAYAYYSVSLNEGETCESLATASPKRPVLIFLHGYNATDEDIPGSAEGGGGNIAYARGFAGLTGALTIMISAETGVLR